MSPLCLLATIIFLSQPPTPAVLPLWEGKAPFAVGDSKYDKPNLTVYAAPKASANGAAVVVCPGGGYGALAMDHEGKQVAEFFNKLGVSAFVLQYRIVQKDRPGPLAPAPLLDAQRAIRLVRYKAMDYGIDTSRVGLIGFSAGGNLASTAGTHFDDGKKDGDPVDRMGCRPDFLMLCYGVISMESGVTHAGSRNNLIGKNPDPKLVEEYSNELHVTNRTPPTFLFHTNEDTAVKSENSIRFYLALKKAKVPAELHIYEKGRHGVGMNPKTGAKGTDTWGGRLADWLKTRGVLEKK
ncbi:MAG TPA: alpha/beta hydrolase [Fimbriiglobus sp.]|jgi:acetyl esterase/lipase